MRWRQLWTAAPAFRHVKADGSKCRWGAHGWVALLDDLPTEMTKRKSGGSCSVAWLPEGASTPHILRTVVCSPLQCSIWWGQGLSQFCANREVRKPSTRSIDQKKKRKRSTSEHNGQGLRPHRFSYAEKCCSSAITLAEALSCRVRKAITNLPSRLNKKCWF